MRSITWSLDGQNCKSTISGRGCRCLARRETLGPADLAGLSSHPMHVNAHRATLAHLAAGLLILMLSACGGGGGGGSSAPPPPSATTPTPDPAQTDFQSGIFRDAREYEALCLAPRAGTSDLQGTTEDENNWLRAWSHDLYLWYDEIIDEDPAAFETPAYFDLMQTFQTTQTGAPKDNFHFTQDTAAFQQLINSGIQAEYGFDWEWIRNSPPREAVIVYVQSDTPAASVGLERGDRILEIDGESLVDGNDADTLNSGLFPDSGTTHDFVVARADGSNQRAVTVTAVELALEPVPISEIISTPQGAVGYLFLISYIDPAEQALFNTLSSFAAAGITELIVDVRYNRGGLLDIANELSYMIAGPTATEGRTFGELIFNDKYPDFNPVTNAPLGPDGFLSTAQGFSVSSGTPLPTLNLSRVHFLVGASTASANEFAINGLRGIDFEVILVGEKTTGKPFGFYPTDNCGTTYFSIQFQTVNEKGFGGFSQGFVPTERPVLEYEVQGCPVVDDYETALGNENEARLSTALGLIAGQDCAAATPSGSISYDVAARTITQSVDAQSEQTIRLNAKRDLGTLLTAPR